MSNKLNLAIAALLLSCCITQAQIIPPAGSGSDSRLYTSGTNITITSGSNTLVENISGTGSGGTLTLPQTVVGIGGIDFNINTAAGSNSQPLLQRGDIILGNFIDICIYDGNGNIIIEGSDGHLNYAGSSLPIDDTSGQLYYGANGGGVLADTSGRLLYGGRNASIFADGANNILNDPFGDLLSDGNNIYAPGGNNLAVINSSGLIIGTGNGLSWTSGTLSFISGTGGPVNLSGSGTIVVTGGTLSITNTTLSGTGAIAGAVAGLNGSQSPLVVGNPSNFPAGAVRSEVTTASGTVVIRVMATLTGTNILVIPTGTYSVRALQ